MRQFTEKEPNISHSYFNQGRDVAKACNVGMQFINFVWLFL